MAHGNLFLLDWIFVADSWTCPLLFKLNYNKVKYMAEVKLTKTSEKLIIWLHRENKTQQWLADQLGQTRQSVSQKIKGNYFSVSDLIKIKSLGFNVE